MSNDSSLELYGSRVSTCSQRVRFVLSEKKITFVDRPIKLEAGEHLSPEYLAINPNGLVPALVHDGRVVVDSSVINEYLDEVFRSIPLVPSDAYGRARMRGWVQYLDEVLTPSIRYPSFQAFFGGHIRSLSDEQRREFAGRLPLRKYFALEIVGSEGFPAERLDAAMERIEASLRRINSALTNTAWLAGDKLTLADIAAMPSIVRLDDLGRSELWSDLPAITDWYGRISEMESFKSTYSTGRLGVNAN